MTHVLVASYSRSGTTQGVADSIADRLGADRREIMDVIPRDGWTGYLRSAIEATTRGIPAFHIDFDPAAYDMIVVGSPVWVGTMASPVRSFLQRYGPTLARPAFFCTCGGAGAERALAEMRAMSLAYEAPCFSVRQNDLRRKRHERSLREFSATLQRMAGIAPAAA